MEILRFGSKWAAGDLRPAIRDIVERNQVQEGLVRITISAPEEERLAGTAAITARTLPAIPPHPALHLAATARRVSGPLSQCKSLSRAMESMALRETHAEGAFDAILLNEKGRVVETTSRNLFVVVGGSLRTPPTYDGALPGITRAAVLDLARRLGIKAQETSLTVDAVRGAEELFLTGSGIGILGVSSLDGHRYAEPGPVTQTLADAFARALDAESKW